jgi:hypothetical protein
MSLTAELVYSVRFGPKLPLPKVVQDNIAGLRITPVPFKPPYRAPQKFYNQKKPHQPDNWRENALADSVRRVKERDDPEYSDVFGALNKVSTRTLDKLSEQIIVNIEKRDELFRLRVTTLLFDLAITQSGYANLMADCAGKLVAKIPEIKEDLVVQTQMFPKLYSMTDTIVYPSISDTSFADKVVEWMKMKDKRRGYAKFITQLFIRNLVDESIVVDCLTNVASDLATTAKHEKTEQSEENTTQYVDFMFETAKILPSSSALLRSLLKSSIKSVLEVPRPELPSLSMRSRFKLEDALKCVH